MRLTLWPCLLRMNAQSIKWLRYNRLYSTMPMQTGAAQITTSRIRQRTSNTRWRGQDISTKRMRIATDSWGLSFLCHRRRMRIANDWKHWKQISKLAIFYSTHTTSLAQLAYTNKPCAATFQVAPAIADNKPPHIGVRQLQERYIQWYWKYWKYWKVYW